MRCDYTYTKPEAMEGDRAKDVHLCAICANADTTKSTIEHFLSGAFFTGTGNKFNKWKGHPLPQGSYAFIPAGMRHFAWVEELTVVQVQGNGRGS